MFFTSEDKRLIDKCLKNDRMAQKDLFEKYYTAMFNIAFRIVREEDLAYDVVQETFIIVFNNLHRFQFRSTLGVWIRKILVREAVRKVKWKTGNEQELKEEIKDPVVWPDDFTGEYLHKAIMALPDGYRLVFTLVEIEGYSHKEVAQMMNISEGTSKSQLYYAKKNLQKKLSNLVKHD